jgi:hypothetical protein
VHIKRTQVAVIAGLLLLLLVLPQLALAQPEISNVEEVDVTATTATITWLTSNNASDSLVKYGINFTLDKTKSDPNMVLVHNITLTDLAPGTVYFYEVWSGGVRSPANTGDYHSFQTTPLPHVEYSITLDPACGVCGDLWRPEVCWDVIKVTAVVAGAGDYRICWDSRAATSVVYGGAFTATGHGVYTLTFNMPLATRGIHKVYLTTNFYDDLGPKAVAEFIVNPSVKIDPEEGPVGTNVTLNGYGFDASQAIGVTLFQGEVKKGEEKSTAAGPKGNWSMTYTIPATPGGGYTFNVGPPNTNEVYLKKYFKVTPKITVTPGSGAVGWKTRVDGTGFASEEEDIKVTFDREVRVENIAADVHGSWTAYITVPIRTCANYIVNASGETTRARDVDYAEFSVVAGIAVTPALAYVGSEITVTGGGFAPREEGVKVTFDYGAVVAADIPVDIYGCWESSFTLPPSVHGSHIVSASGKTTAAVETTIDTQAQILEITPEEGSRGDFIRLTGNGFHGSQRLTVTVGGAPALETLATSPNGDVAINFRVPSNSVLGQQPVVVTDEAGATGSTNLTVIAKTLSIIPLPISPKDSTLRSGMVTFRWQGMTGSTGYSYTLEITGEGSTLPKTTTESTYPLTQDEALGKGTYHWRVKVVDDYGNEGPWSESIEFRVSPIPTWVWVVVGLVVLVVLLVVAYRETKFRVTE